MLGLRHKCFVPGTQNTYVKSCIGGRDNSTEGHQVRFIFSYLPIERIFIVATIASQRAKLEGPRASQNRPRTSDVPGATIVKNRYCLPAERGFPKVHLNACSAMRRPRRVARTSTYWTRIRKSRLRLSQETPRAAHADRAWPARAKHAA